MDEYARWLMSLVNDAVNPWSTDSRGRPWTQRGVPGFLRGMVEGAQRNPGQFALDMTPVVGDVKAVAYDAPQAMASGNTGLAMLAMASAIPGVPNLAKAAGDAPRTIRAYHGSPHDFDRFSMDKIGTGEGAQAYGHGLYFAESEDVARQYRNDLDRGPAVRAADGETIRIPPVLQQYLDQGDHDAVIANMRRDISQTSDPARIAQKESMIRAIEAHRAGAEVVPGGRMYEVEIKADPDEFLDWDAPLPQQSQKVRDALDRAAPNVVRQDFRTRSLPNGMVEIVGPTGDGMGHYRPDEVDEAITNLRSGYDRVRGGRPLTGGEFVERYRPDDPNVTGSQVWMDHDFAGNAAQRLREAGIPGIRYMDAGSRMAPNVEMLEASLSEAKARLARLTADSPMRRTFEVDIQLAQKAVDDARAVARTRNYVVFDDSLIEILRKYGIAGLLGAGVAGRAANRQETR